MVMELLEGDTLKTRLSDHRLRNECMPQGEVARILLDVLEGLGHAHDRGMIHRDVKPSNIMLTKAGQAVITDFGIAQIVGGTLHTVSGVLMGTPSYMAPEQGLEGQSDARSDIYSLGVVLYEMLTQRTPFEADTPLAILMRHLNDPLPLPCEVDPAIPLPLERVVLKALSKSPDERFQSALEMAQALREATEQAQVELPVRVSPPLSFTTPEAPTESVAVLSGTARSQVSDVRFAEDQTQTRLTQAPTPQRARREWRDRLAYGPALRRIGGRLRQMMHISGGRQDDAAAAPVEPEEAASRRARNRAIMGAIGLTLALAALMNLAALLFAGLTGSWALLERGWPMEFFLVGLGLCAAMAIMASIWLLIPVGIALGTGLLFTYSSLTGRWDHWVFLWALELVLVVATVLLTVWLESLGEVSRKLSRVLAWVLGAAALACSIIIPWVALVTSG
jgi:hypothetical protein